jgi:D-aminopeptidase
MVSGDDKLAIEVKELLPETIYAKVKDGLGIA